jgi:hypothetical protein
MGQRRILTVAVAALLGLVAGPLVAGPAGSQDAGASSTTTTTDAPQLSAMDDDVHLNQIQVIGSHNSYKQMVSPAEDALRRQFIGQADDLMTYQHRPLAEQFQSERSARSRSTSTSTRPVAATRTR